MRVFAAVPLSEGLRARLAEALSSLRRTGADCRWVEPANLHLTLAFLGEVPETRLDAVRAALSRAARGAKPFDLELRGWGGFPTLERPRVLWVGVLRGGRESADLAAALRQELAREGLSPQEEPGRAFHAHLTVGRLRGGRGLAALMRALAAQAPPEGLVQRVERLAIYRSRLSSGGPAYEELFEARL